MVLRLSDWAGPSPKASAPKPSPKATSKPEPKQRTGIAKFLFGNNDREESARAKQAAATARAPKPTQEQIRASAGSGARGGSGMVGLPQRIAAAPKAEPKQWDSEGWKEREARRWSNVAVTRELSQEEWGALNPQQQRMVEFNKELVTARDADRTDGGARVLDLRSKLGLSKKEDGDIEDFSSLLAGFTERDLKGTGYGSLTPATGVRATPNQHQRLVESISKGLEARFAKAEATAASDVDDATLSATLGVSDSGAKVDEPLENLLKLVVDANSWSGGATVDDVRASLAEGGYDPEVFWQLAGDRLAQADATGQQLGSLTNDEVRQRLALVTE